MPETIEQQEATASVTGLAELERVGQSGTGPGVFEILHLLWGERKWLLRTTFYGLLAATLLAFLIPKRYESTARLMPPDSSSSSSLAMLASVANRIGSLGNVAGDFLGIKSSSALFVGILQSRTVQDRLIEKFNLRRVYWAWTIEDAREALADWTAISEDRKSGIVTIRVTDKDPNRAKAMAQVYVEELNRLVAEVSTSSARRERQFIEQRLKVVKQEWDAAAKEFSQFASKNTAIDIKEQGRAMVEAAALLQGQLFAAQTELHGLTQIYADQNVRVRALKARVAELQRQLQELGGNPGEFSSPKQGQDEAGYPSIRQLPLLGVPYADLYRRMRIAETVFELLTQQYEIAKVQEAKEIPTVKVLDYPVVPEKKSFPSRLLIMLLGTLVVFSACISWILAKSQWEAASATDPRWFFLRQVVATLKSEVSGVSKTILRRGTPRATALADQSGNGSPKRSSD